MRVRSMVAAAALLAMGWIGPGTIDGNVAPPENILKPMPAPHPTPPNPHVEPLPHLNPDHPTPETPHPSHPTLPHLDVD